METFLQSFIELDEEDWRDHQKPFRERLKKYLTSWRIQITLCYALAFLELGLLLAALGPALLPLAERAHILIDSTGFLFTGRSIGYLIGSALGGPLFDRYPPNRIMALSLILVGVASIAFPFITNFYFMCFLLLLMGNAMGILDTGGNVSIIWVHGTEKTGPYLQFLHFAFGLGALISPLIVGAVLDSNPHNPSAAFVALGVIAFPVSAWLLFLENPQKSDTDQAAKLGKWEYLVVFGTALFLFCYVGTEVVAGGYLSTYANIKDFLSVVEAAFLVSLFWLFLTIGRLLSIPASIYFSAKQILFVNLGGTIFSIALIVVFSSSLTALYLGICGFGFFMGSTFPTAILLCESYVNMTGKIASVLVVGASLGEMVLPLISSTILAYAADFFPVLLFFSAVFGFIVFGCIVGLGFKTAKLRDPDSIEMDRRSFSGFGDSDDENDNNNDSDEDHSRRLNPRFSIDYE